MKRIFLLTMILVCVASFINGQTNEDYHWQFIGKIDTPLKLWTSFITMKEVNPIYKACIKLIMQDKTLMIDEYIKKLEPNSTKYFGLDIKTKTPMWYLWSVDDSGKSKYLSSSDTIIDFFNPVRFKLDKASKPLPKLFKSLETQQEIVVQVKYFKSYDIKRIKKVLKEITLFPQTKSVNICKRNIRVLKEKIKNENKSFSSIQKPPCPLGGEYSFHNNIIDCSHKLQETNINKFPFNDYGKEALIFLDCLTNSSNFNLTLDNISKDFKISFSIDQQVDNYNNALLKSVDFLQWFSNISTAQPVPSDSHYSIIISPDFSKFHLSPFTPPHLQNILGSLPKGLWQIMGYGSPLPFRQLPPLSITANLTKDSIDGYTALIRTMGMHVEDKKEELYGQLLRTITIPSRNQANPTKSTKIFICNNSNNSKDICLGEKIAIAKLAIHSQEANSVSLWNGINGKVRFAIAFNLKTIALGLLKLTNKLVFSSEAKVCRKNVSKWKDTHRKQAKALTQGDEIPKELFNCCPRHGIFIPKNSYSNNCAVHSRRSLWELDTQLFNPIIKTNRWLRIYIVKEKNIASLKIDIINTEDTK